MSADLEEVDVQQQLKKAEESGDDTESIVLSEKSGLDTDDEEEEIQVNEDILDDVKEGQENDSWNWMTDDTNDKEIKLEIIDNKPSSTLLYNDNSPLIEGDIPEGLQEEFDKLDNEDYEDDDEDDEDARARARGDDARRTPKRGVEDDAVDIARIRSVATTRDRERRGAGRDVGGERARGVESVSES